MNLHPYLVVYMEVNAVKNWLYKMQQANEPNIEKTREQLFRDFRNSFCNNPLAWNYFDNYELTPKPSRTEKILYLYFHRGLGMNKIQKILGSSPNFVMKTVQNERVLRQLPPHGIGDVIPDWKKLKQFIPDEIFYKYL